MSATTVWPPVESTNVMNSTQFFDIPCNYILLKKKLGDGLYSVVYECKNKSTGSHYAAKKYLKRLVFGLEAMLQLEFHVLQRVSMSHPNILTLADHFETKDDLFLVTDLCSGGELFDKIVNNEELKLSEQLSKEITTTLVSTIEYLHSNHIVHRDVKAENVLFQSKTSHKILVADFGLARVLHGGEKLNDVLGTLSYMAPEMLLREHGHEYAVDVWALGVLVYFMLCGYMPFDCETDNETKEAISKGDFHFEPVEYWENISPEAKDFLKCCFVVDPKKRSTMKELERHAFVAHGRTRVQAAHASHLRQSHSASSTIPVPLQRNSSNVSLHHRLEESVRRFDLLQNSESSHKKARGSSSNLSESSGTFSSLSLLPLSTSLTPLYAKLTQMEKSRNAAMAEGAKLLKGAMCTSPEQVSQFSTPLHSTAVSAAGSAAASRQVSSTDLEMMTSSSENGLQISTKAPASFYI